MPACGARVPFAWLAQGLKRKRQGPRVKEEEFGAFTPPPLSLSESHIWTLDKTIDFISFNPSLKMRNWSLSD